MGLVELAATKALASSAVLLFITVLLMASAKRISTCIVLFGAQCAVLTSQILALAFVHKSGLAACPGETCKSVGTPLPNSVVLK